MRATIHLGGTAEQIVAIEAATVRGEMPDQPFMLVGQQYLADPSRSADGLNPIWSYAHVPHAYPGDATEAVIGQIERFAPGFRDTIVETHVRNVPQMAAYNANYVGGDICAGANTFRQIAFRPRPAVNPYTRGCQGGLSVLGGDATRARRARHGRVQRRRDRPRAPVTREWR